MSAFIVSTDHIDYLVTAAAEAGIGGGGVYWHDPAQGQTERVDYTNASEIGARLLAANIASVAYRYDTIPAGESLPGPVPNPTPDEYEFSPFHVTAIDPVQVLKACDCYEYQSCERPEWLGSPAWRFVDALRGAYIGRLKGYDGARWEIDRLEMLKERATRRRHAEG